MNGLVAVPAVRRPSLSELVEVDPIGELQALSNRWEDSFDDPRWLLARGLRVLARYEDAEDRLAVLGEHLADLLETDLAAATIAEALTQE